MELEPDGRNMHISQDGRGQPNPYSVKELAGRIGWATTYWSLYRWIPRQLNWWHRAILRLFGAKLGKSVTIYPSAHITCPWNLILEDYSVVGPGVELFALGAITVGKHSVLSQWGILRNARKRDAATPRGGRRLSGCKPLSVGTKLLR